MTLFTTTKVLTEMTNIRFSRPNWVAYNVLHALLLWEPCPSHPSHAFIQKEVRSSSDQLRTNCALRYTVILPEPNFVKLYF